MLSPASRRLLPVALIAAGLGAAPPAFGHGGEVHLSAKDAAKHGTARAVAEERAHAKEHEAVARDAARIERMTAKQKRRLRLRALGKVDAKGRAVARRAAEGGGVNDQPVGPSYYFGSWSAPTKAPTYAIHGMLMPTGRVLVFSMGNEHGNGRELYNTGADVNNDGAAAVWDPERGTGPSAFKLVPPPQMTLPDPSKRPGYDKPRAAPIFCAGQVQLADGRMLVAGGNLETLGNGYGIKTMFLFDPWKEAWVRNPDLKYARWYPTLTRLPDGRVAILSGNDENAVNRPEVEVYPADGAPVPGIGTSDAVVSGTTVKLTRAVTPDLYPLAFVMKNGSLAQVGPGPGDGGIINPRTWSWTKTNGFPGEGNRGYPSAILEMNTVDGPDRVFAFGGLSASSWFSSSQAQAALGTIRPGIDRNWSGGPSLNIARRNAPAVQLPDGNVLLVGGGNTELRGVDPMDAWPSRRQPEIFDLGTGRWWLGPAQSRPRGYHSIAMLLPDGRVLSAGDDLQSTLFDDDLSDVYDTSFELYSPGYLHRGPRPVITGAPARASYDQTFQITVEGAAADVPYVTVTAPASQTHGVDMNQRQLLLRVLARQGNTLTVQAPPNANAAPPGDYMIWAFTRELVPSKAQWIQFLPPGAQGHPPASAAPVWAPGDTLAGPDGDTGGGSGTGGSDTSTDG